MLFSLSRILQDVRVRLDQNIRDEELLRIADKDTLELDGLIMGSMERSARAAILDAPVYRLESGHNFGEALYWGEGNSGWTLLPDDFLRLVVFEMSDWQRAVYNVLTPLDSDYALQNTPFAALRGNPSRPVCAVVLRPEGLALEFYSCRDDEAYITQAAYTPAPRIDRDGCIDFPEDLYEAVVCLTAADTAAALGESNLATALMEQYKTMIQ